MVKSVKSPSFRSFPKAGGHVEVIGVVPLEACAVAVDEDRQGSAAMGALQTWVKFSLKGGTPLGGSSKLGSSW